ncbi:2'-O-glycosyltransferase CruG [Leptolyngbya sp. FACHB-261]|uniref:2'-O-glycosyltransferase CruG n=1 Tax=Leptolyngbya sp. FACHB-261 TaxID=2692806 RepID=UPI0028C4FA14|nr:glycosyltransferase family 2 protein [Leptolyngbya sp. FACHB-261]
MALLLLLIQGPAAAILLSRLLQGPGRRPPLQPKSPTLDLLGKVSVVVPTLNEAERIGPCLDGLTHQSYEVREILVVDSRSEDGTPELVKTAQQSDPRFRLLTDDPLPAGWVGRPWALHTGFLHTSPASEWVLGIDADTQPQPGLVASLVQAADQEGLDLVSLSPRFILKSVGEQLLQPALLLTLVYRFGPAGERSNGAERVMANGQCFLARRALLEQLDGYSCARASFCDDVTLARAAAASGAKVGFLDGCQVLKVRMYASALETWHEWGRSLDLKDATSPAQKWGDLGFLLAVQALPWLALPLLLLAEPSLPVQVAIGLNASLLLTRFALLLAIRGSYEQVGWAFWLSPLADPLAVLRIAISTLSTPKRWRGRDYSSFGA